MIILKISYVKLELQKSTLSILYEASYHYVFDLHVSVVV
jgi:hypothetical protein